MLKLLLTAAMMLASGSIAHAGPPQVEGGDDAGYESAAGQEPLDPTYERGDYLPVQFRGDYLINWRAYGLQKPEKGFKWIRIGHNAYLINLTSGLITDTFDGVDG